METRKLYYEDSDLQEFTATVESCQAVDGGYCVILDQTAFYPEGGGQACDLGTLGSAQVLDVQEKGQQVCHLCDRPLAVGLSVTGRIQWDRRFDLMQQHAGEHILSGLIHARFGYQNSGFHVGQQVMEVDFDGPIPQDALQELELAANRVIWENLPILSHFPSPQALAELTYRTKRALPWPVRIVEVPGVDRCACCGVHVKYTGQIGLVKILSCVKFHQGVRLEMVCGQRAYGYMQDIFEQNRQISQLLSAKMPETAQAVSRLQQMLSAEKLRSAATERRLFDAIAAGYRGQENVVHFESAMSGGSLRELSDRIGSACSGIAAVFAGSDQEGYSMCLISQHQNVKPLGTAAVGQLNGRGGGKENAFQGSVKATRAQIRAFFDAQQDRCAFAGQNL